MTAIVERATGRIVKTISAPDDVVEMNTPEDCYTTSDPPDRGMLHVGGEWLYIPSSPGEGFVFDYATRTWSDTRTLNQIREAHWVKVKSQRDSLEFGGFEFEGGIYDSDQVSQGRILGAVLAGLPQIWTLANNTTVSLSAEQLKSLYAALQMHVAVAHERGRIAREAIQAATTKEQIEAIMF